MSALRVLQLNTWNTEGPWERRLFEIVAIISKYEPDVVCLQEVVCDADGYSTAHLIAEQLRSLSTSLPTHVALATTPYPEEVLGIPEGQEWGVAVLSRWPIDAMNSQLLADGWPSMWIVLHALTNGLDVFSTHLTPASHDGVWREQQALELDAFVRANRATDSPLPAIVGGDLNALPDAAEVRFLAGLQSLAGRSTYFQDAWAVAGDGGPGHTWDNENPFAARFHLHPRRVDYVLVGDHFPLNAPNAPGAEPGPGTGRVLRCEVVGRQPLTGTHASDHYGVLADVAWPSRPTDR